MAGGKTKKKVTWAEFSAYVKKSGLDEPLNVICKANYTTLEEVFSDRKGKLLAHVRSECWMWLYDRGRSYPEIGSMWGRDHSTILGWVKKRLAEREGGVPGS